MTAWPVNCVIIACNGCGREFEDDYTTHFQSAEQARDHIQGNSDWFCGDGEDWCDDCRVLRAHAFVDDVLRSWACARCGIDRDEHDAVPSSVGGTS